MWKHYELPMNDATVLLLPGVGVAVVIALIVVAARRGGSKERDIFSRMAAEFSWQAVSPLRMVGGVRGTWNLFAVRLEKHARYKSVPERLILKVQLQSPARVVITKRYGNRWWHRPLVLFGPRVATPLALANPERFWVRSDEPALIERLFADARIGQLLEENLIERFDVVDLQQGKLVIRRATDERVVKKKLNRPTFEWRSNPAYLETVGRAEWELAKAIVEQLGLRPG
jgi:hypothetical protein